MKKKVLRKALAQIRNICWGLPEESRQTALDMLVSVRDDLIILSEDAGITVQDGDKCPPPDPDCDPIGP